MALSEYSERLLGAYAEQPFLMAPMAGVTDPAYRIMCRRRGAHLAYSEMVSVAGLAYASNKTWRLVLPADEEQQICVQLFGSKPDQFASAVAAVEERVGDRLSLIDINMACPARKVVTKGEGSALMRTPDLAEAARRRNQALVAWFEPHRQSGALRDLPCELMPSLVMGPVQSYCRAWLSGNAAQGGLPSPTTYRTELAEAAWRSVRA